MILGTLKQIGTQPEWFTDAVCPQVDPELFFDKALAPDAKRVCVNCPVRSECLRYAMGKSDLDGVWGGMTWEERRSVRLGHRGVASVSHCVACGRGFLPRDGRNKFCRSSCKQAHHRTLEKSFESLVGNKTPNAKLNSA